MKIRSAIALLILSLIVGILGSAGGVLRSAHADYSSYGGNDPQTHYIRIRKLADGLYRFEKCQRDTERCERIGARDYSYAELKALEKSYQSSSDSAGMAWIAIFTAGASVLAGDTRNQETKNIVRYFGDRVLFNDDRGPFTVDEAEKWINFGLKKIDEQKSSPSPAPSAM